MFVRVYIVYFRFGMFIFFSLLLCWLSCDNRYCVVAGVLCCNDRYCVVAGVLCCSNRYCVVAGVLFCSNRYCVVAVNASI